MKLARAGLLLLALATGAVRAEEPGLQVSGYAKSILMDSNTVVGPDQPYTLALNRLRLELKGPVAPSLALDLEVDNELLLGDYLGTQQFQLQKNLPPTTFWDATATWVDAPHAYGQLQLYRGSLTASIGGTDVRVGRQRIAWGTGRFWSPLDILNPLSPIALERAERVGVDAVLVEHKVDAVSRAAFVFAPQHFAGDDSVAAMWHGNRAGIDYSLVGGRFARDDVIGGDLAGQLGEAGIRAELTHTAREGTSSFVRALLGVDYAFANTLILSGELYYDGSGSADPARYDFAALFSGRVQNLAQRYLGATASYEITPLLKARFDLVFNLDDHSRYASPTLTWSMRSDLDGTLGAQLYSGAPGTEYGAFKRLLYLQLQWFF